ncbi:MAG TPA: hypothetical protein VHM91_07510 [Verrucomicrobiales bacterium]|nr:hypothetical protein [Verrucomicrobiales bacterium]
MLPLFYTRQYLLDCWTTRRAQSSKSMIYSAENNLYAVRRVDTAAMPDHRSTIVFECDLVHGERGQKVFLGLMETDAVSIAAHSPGIGISVDLHTGLVTDVVNDQGVLGYLECAPIEADGPLHVRIEVDMIGRVLLPRIVVGNDVILHPALYLDAREGLSALVGTSVHPLGDARFENTLLRTEEPDGWEVLTASR